MISLDNGCSLKDSEQNKAVNLDTSDWKLIKAPGPWTLVELGKHSPWDGIVECLSSRQN